MDFKDLILNRANLVAEVFSGLPHFDGFIRCQMVQERYDQHDDGSSYLKFHSNKNRGCMIEFDNIKPDSVSGLQFHEPTVLDSKQIDATDLLLDNKHGTSTLSETYEATFIQTTSESSSFTQGLSESISESLGVDSGLGITSESNITIEATEEWAKSKDDGTEVDRTISIEVNAKKGYIVRYIASRFLEKRQRVATGLSSFEHNVKITVEDKDPMSPGHVLRPYLAQAKYDSFQQLVSVVSGKAGDNIDYGKDFRDKPTIDPLLNALITAGRGDFNHTFVYDSVTRQILKAKTKYPKGIADTQRGI